MTAGRRKLSNGRRKLTGQGWRIRSGGFAAPASTNGVLHQLGWDLTRLASPPLLAVIILVLTVVLLATNKVHPPVVAILVLGLTGALGLVPYQSLFQGFANPAVILIAAMMVLGEGLQRTGVTARLGRWVAMRAAGAETRTISLLMLAAAVPSALVSDVGVITIFIRMVEGMRAKLGLPPSRLLLPMAFGASLGGLLTLVGTSGNILADQFLRRAGSPGLSLFALTPLGAILVVTGVLYILFLGRRLLPDRPEDADRHSLYGLRQYRSELAVLDDFPGNGLSLKELALPRKLGIQILRIVRRNGSVVEHPGPRTVIESGDLLWGQGAALDLLRSPGSFDYPGLRLVEERGVLGEEETYVEALVTPESPLRGHTLAEFKFRQRYGLSVVAVSRLGEMSVGDGAARRPDAPAEGRKGWLSALRRRLAPGEPLTRTETVTRSAPVSGEAFADRVGKVMAAVRKAAGRDPGAPAGPGRKQEKGAWAQLCHMRLQVGDTLLLRGAEEGFASLAQSGVLLLQQEVDYRPPRSHRAVLSVVVMGAVILAGATGLLPIAVAAVLGAGVVVLAGCLTTAEALGSLDLRLLVLVAGMLALGSALDRTGVVSLVAHAVLKTAGEASPVLLMGVVYLLAAVLTQVLSNAVTVVLVAPLAVQAAVTAHLNPAPLVVGVAVAVSASPASPYGNQVNLLVMGPGRYRPGDYLRVGLPLTLVNMAVSLALIPVFWPFRA